MLATTDDRVADNTTPVVNRRIAAEIVESVRWHAAHPQNIDRRLRELNREWDIDRALQAHGAALALAGVLMAGMGRRRWLGLSAAAAGFLFNHAVEGWCPPLQLFRRLGFRTTREIESERYALKALRGDFGPIGPDPADHDTRASHALLAARL